MFCAYKHLILFSETWIYYLEHSNRNQDTVTCKHLIQVFEHSLLVQSIVT